MAEWNFSPDVIAKAKEIGIGARVAIHWSEAEAQDQQGTVVGVDIRPYGKVDYAVHIDGDISPTDGFTHDRTGLQGGTISRLTPDLPLEEELKRLREALKPFAKCSEVYPLSRSDGNVGFAGLYDSSCPLTFGDYHRARQVLSEGRQI